VNVVNQQVFRTAGILVAVLAFILIVLLTWRSLGDLEAQSRISGLDVARSAAARAVMQCYALEGAYPPDLDYLQAYYGLVLDTGRYAYVYEVVGDNVYPIVDIQFREDVSQ
jgi:hypothetical protein